VSRCVLHTPSYRVTLNLYKMENQNEMSNQKGQGGSRVISTSKNQIVPDQGCDDEVYRVDVGERALDDGEYYTNCDSIVSKNGCAAGVMALRKGFELLLADHTDSRFTGRLMKTVAEIFRRDVGKGKMKKSVLFSQQKSFLETVEFNIRKRDVGRLKHQFDISHAESRAEATISVKGLINVLNICPGGATHFRILHHLSIVSDYCYSKSNRRYEPVSMLNGMSAYGYSEYFAVRDIPDIEVRVEFRDGVWPLNEDTVIQCFGLEFYKKSGPGYYLLHGGGGVEVCKVF
jgi:hypothetical protein